MNQVFENAKTFVYRNARPLDIARWQYHFENGSKEAVLNALSHYQNEDGGFAHALEPDSWNPSSSPIQTCTATEILREIDYTDKTHPIVKGILHYLESGKSFNGKFWWNAIKSNNDYPHAPWWHTESDSTSHDDYNPTACLAGFIIRIANTSSELYTLGSRIAKEAFDAYAVKGSLNDMHTASCYIRLLEYCKDTRDTDLFDLSVLEIKIKEQVKISISQNTDEWETSYACKPSQFFNSKSSIFYADNKTIADFECEFIIKTQLKDGSWNIPWAWADYPEQWAISKNWWKSNGAILNMLYLKGVAKL